MPLSQRAAFLCERTTALVTAATAPSTNHSTPDSATPPALQPADHLERAALSLLRARTLLRNYAADSEETALDSLTALCARDASHAARIAGMAALFVTTAHSLADTRLDALLEALAGALRCHVAAGRAPLPGARRQALLCLAALYVHTLQQSADDARRERLWLWLLGVRALL